LSSHPARPSTRNTLAPRSSALRSSDSALHNPSQMDGALAFHESDNLRHRIFRRYRSASRCSHFNPTLLQFGSLACGTPPPNACAGCHTTPLRRHFGINTTWYLHSHFEWLRLSKSSIQFLLEVCLAAHDMESLGGLPKMSNFYCLPGRAGGTPDWISWIRKSARGLAGGPWVRSKGYAIRSRQTPKSPIACSVHPAGIAIGRERAPPLGVILCGTFLGFALEAIP
jgi:hypothetical protein